MNTAIKIKQNKKYVVTDPVKPLQIRFLESRVLEPDCVSYSAAHYPTTAVF